MKPRKKKFQELRKKMSLSYNTVGISKLRAKIDFVDLARDKIEQG